LYKPVLNAETPEAARRLMHGFVDDEGNVVSRGIQGVLDGVDAKFGDGVQTSVAKAVKSAVEPFRTHQTHVGQEIEMPVRSAARLARDPETGNLVRQGGEQVFDQAGKPLTKIVKQGDVTEVQPVYGLKHFLNAKQDLDQAIEASKAMGRATPLTAELTGVKAEIMDAARKSHPEWAQVNDTAAGAHALKRSYEAGLALPLRAASGKQAVDLAAKLNAIGKLKDGDERKTMFARGLMSQIKTKLESAGDTHDLAKFFTNPATRKLLGRVVGTISISTWPVSGWAHGRSTPTRDRRPPTS
jgi:hypothetical protein